MARINLLKPRQIATLPVGFHSDGSNLYLRVMGPERRAWIFRYMSGGKVRQIGLGSTIERSIGEARDLADKMRRAMANGDDPATSLSRRDPESMTFQRYAEELIDAKRPPFSKRQACRAVAIDLETIRLSRDRQQARRRHHARRR